MLQPVKKKTIYDLDRFGGTLKSARDNVLTDYTTPVFGAISTGGIIH
jgi:hypothetical protein